MNDRYVTVNILDVLKSGEKNIQDTLSAFSCPLNPGIEDFLHKKAIQFAKQKLSVTYLVFDKQIGQLAGFFAIAFKTISIREDMLSNTKKKHVAQFATYDSEEGIYMAAAYLIAQFSKNFALKPEELIQGEDLMDIAIDVLKSIQHGVGGGIVYLDAEDKPKLKEFYEERAHFHLFGERFSPTDQKKYLQYLRTI